MKIVNTANNKLAFILYEEKNPPKYFEVKKSTLRFILFGMPIVTLICIVTISLIFIYFKHIENQLKKKEPVVIQALKENQRVLEKKGVELNTLNNQLQKKLLSKAPENLETLNLFKPVLGQKDLSHELAIKIDQVSIKENDDKINFKFNIVNIQPSGQKLSGYIFIILKTLNSFFIYPENAMEHDELQLSFTKGESFGTWRFRPVETNFPNNKQGLDKMLFRIFIFSRTGDLIHKQIVTNLQQQEES